MGDVRFTVRVRVQGWNAAGDRTWFQFDVDDSTTPKGIQEKYDHYQELGRKTAPLHDMAAVYNVVAEYCRVEDDARYVALGAIEPEDHVIQRRIQHTPDGLLQGVTLRRVRGTSDFRRIEAWQRQQDGAGVIAFPITDLDKAVFSEADLEKAFGARVSKEEYENLLSNHAK